jgi:hypothetical protein
MVTKSGRSAGKQMAILGVEDLTGKSGAVAFSETYERVGGLLQEQALVFLAGTVDRSRERPSIIVREVVPLEQALEKLTGSLLLRVNGAAVAAASAAGAVPGPHSAREAGDVRVAPGGAQRSPGNAGPLPTGSPGGATEAPASALAQILSRLSPILAKYKGPCPVYLQLRPAQRPGVCATIRLDRQWFVAPSRPLIEELEALLGGQEYLLLSPRPQTAANGNGSPYARGGNGYSRGNGGPNGRYVPRRAVPARAEEA